MIFYILILPFSGRSGFLSSNGASVKIKNLNFTMPDGVTSIGNSVVGAIDSELHIEDVNFLGITGSAIFDTGTTNGSWTRVSAINFVSTAGSGPINIAGGIWNFTDVTVKDLYGSALQGIFEVTNHASAHTKFTFGGKILVDGALSGGSEGAVVKLYQYSAAPPLIVFSNELNPSNFVLRNSEFVLLSTDHLVDSASFDITLGSVDIVASNHSHQNFFAFWFDRPPAIAKPVPISLAILGDVFISGMGFVTRGDFYGTSLYDKVTNIKIGGDLNLQVPGYVPSALRLTWSTNITARSINVEFFPQSENSSVAAVMLQQRNSFSQGRTALGHVTMASTTSFTIDCPGNDCFFPNPLFNCIYKNTMVTLKSENFSVSNIVRTSGRRQYVPSRHGTLATIENGARMEIITKASMTFKDNKNFGAGGVFFIGNSSASVQPVLKLHTTEDGSIEFSGNLAWFGGVFYATGDTPSGAIEISAKSRSTTPKPIQYDSNQALSAGGVALLPKLLAPTTVPAGMAQFSKNGAFDFGCVFAFAETFSDSNTPGNCSLSLDVLNYGNEILRAGYQWATECLQFEKLCEPLSPDSPVPGTAPADTNPTNPTPMSPAPSNAVPASPRPPPRPSPETNPILQSERSLLFGQSLLYALGSRVIFVKPSLKSSRIR